MANLQSKSKNSCLDYKKIILPSLPHKKRRRNKAKNSRTLDSSLSVVVTCTKSFDKTARKCWSCCSQFHFRSPEMWMIVSLCQKWIFFSLDYETIFSFQLLIIDSRSFLEYNTLHVAGAVNVCCSKLVKRRLQQDKVSNCFRQSMIWTLKRQWWYFLKSFWIISAFLKHKHSRINRMSGKYFVTVIFSIRK